MAPTRCIRSLAGVHVLLAIFQSRGTPLAAQTVDGTVFAGGALLTSDLSEEFTADVGGGVETAVQSHDNSLALGAHLGVRWSRVAVEGTLAVVPTDLVTDLETSQDITEDQTILLISGNVLYDIIPGRFFDVFVAAGVGLKSYSADDPAGGFEAGSDPMFNIGGGARLAITEALSIRADIRDYISSFDAFEDVEGSSFDAQTQHDVLITLGLRYSTGGR